MAEKTLQKFLYWTPKPPREVRRWSELPEKIKISVLSELLRYDDGNIPAEEMDIYATWGLDSLIGTGNRELMRLASQVFYSKNWFSVYILSLETQDLSKMRPEMVEKLFVYVEPCESPDTLDDTLFRERDAWSGLLRYKPGYNDQVIIDQEVDYEGGSDCDDKSERSRRGPVVCPATSWQRAFTNLRELNIMINVNSIQCEHMVDSRDPDSTKFRILGGLLARTKMDFRAKAIGMEFDILSPRSSADFENNGNGHLCRHHHDGLLADISGERND